LRKVREYKSLCSHHHGNFQRLTHGTVQLRNGITLQSVVKGGFVDQDSRVLAYGTKGLGGTTVATVGDLEVVVEDKADAFGAAAVTDRTGYEVPQAAGFA
jgi:hypothetical protein